MSPAEHLRQAASDADVEAFVDLGIASFGNGRSRAQVTHWASLFRREDIWLAECAGQPVAGASIARADQWWGGRAQPVACISGVSALPEVRGQGITSRLLVRLHEAIRAEGVGIAALYASTFQLYRKLGYELAGGVHLRAVRLRELGRDVGQRTLTVRATERAELEAYERDVAAQVPPDNGNVARGPFFWGRLFRDDARAVVFANASGGVEGYAILSSPAMKGHRIDYELKAWHAATPAALAHLLAWLRDCASMADQLVYRAAAVDPITLALPGQCWETEVVQPWFLRILDVSTAFTKRGYPPGVAATLQLTVDDALFPANRGPWRIEVAAGQATVTAGQAPATLHIDARGLAAWFAGAVSLRTLVQLGRAAANPAGLVAAEAIADGSAAWIQDMF